VSKNLFGALLLAQGRVSGLGKDGRNEHQRYDYTSSEVIIHHAGRALNLEGLILFRDGYTVGEWVEMTLATKRGPQAALVAEVTSTWTLAHAASGETRQFEARFPASVGAGRPADKAVCSALTASIGYFLRDLLMIARGHDEFDIDRDRPTPRQEVAQPNPIPGHARLVDMPPAPEHQPEVRQPQRQEREPSLLDARANQIMHAFGPLGWGFEGLALYHAMGGGKDRRPISVKGLGERELIGGFLRSFKAPQHLAHWIAKTRALIEGSAERVQRIKRSTDRDLTFEDIWSPLMDVEDGPSALSGWCNLLGVSAPDAIPAGAAQRAVALLCHVREQGAGK